jgi:RND family efflux transporter MFP subunit
MLDEKKSSSSKRRKGSFLFPLAIIILTLFLIEFFAKQEKEREIKREEQSLPLARVMRAKPESQEVPLTLPSFLVGYNATPILARINGYLKDFYVDIGDHVKVGQLLCEIDAPDVDSEIPPATGNLASLKAKLEIAQVTAERWMRLYRQDPDAVPKEEVDQTIAAYQSAIADVEAAQATVEHLKILQNFKYVYASFDGIISERNIDLGSLVSAGNETLTQPYVTGYEVLTQPLFKIIRSDMLRAFVEVPQPYYPYIQNGVKAQVTVPEYPYEIFSGVIDRNASALDQLARTLLTQVNIENKGNLLRPGLYTEVKFAFKPYANFFHIPIAAVIIRDGPPFVAIVQEDDTVLLQQVRIGRDFGKSVQIVKGLREGDRIILNPNFKTKDGIKVKIVEEEGREEGKGEGRGEGREEVRGCLKSLTASGLRESSRG